MVWIVKNKPQKIARLFIVKKDEKKKKYRITENTYL